MIASGIHNLINHCFGKDIDKEDSQDAAILCPANAAAQFVNQLVLERLLRKSGGEARKYFSATSLEKSKELQTENDEQRLHYPPEYFNRLESASIPPHKIHLVPGANVMLIRNPRVGGGHCNGTRLTILKLFSTLLIGKIMTGSKIGETVVIFRILFATNELSLPGKLCYAITVNKSPGQTSVREGLYLRTPL
ncbi:hypothetical protein FOCC_FOCC006564 [Frankliniella occidentalis]|nr:hypothetical protein FOCC_FOCC006564 [Frankliniella occidentalis]